MMRTCKYYFLLVFCVSLTTALRAAEPKPVMCEGYYKLHLQGVCLDDERSSNIQSTRHPYLQSGCRPSCHNAAPVVVKSTSPTLGKPATGPMAGSSRRSDSISASDSGLMTCRIPLLKRSSSPSRYSLNGQLRFRVTSCSPLADPGKSPGGLSLNEVSYNTQH